MNMIRAAAVSLVLVAASVAAVHAQGDEIQVYDGGLAPRGTFNLTVHNNYTPNGSRTAAFPGAIISHRSLNGVPEWALGVTDWFEAGLYLPLYSIDETQGAKLDGVKLRTLFAVPNADARTFFYGANFEFSMNAKHWDRRRITSEIRPIIGWHFRPVDLIFNPILDTDYTGGIRNLEFVPSVRLAYNLADGWAVAAEEYAGFGRLGDLSPRAEQSHQLFAVVDRSTKLVDIEFGAGVGLNSVSDKFTLKLILARNLN